MGDLSAHFSRWEFRDHIDGSLVGPDPELVELLERIRSAAGRPLTIVSGYRTQHHQQLVNPGVRGYHPLGRAADLHPGAVTVSQADLAGAGGIGRCGKWAVHVDTRRRPRSGRAVIFEDC